MWLNISGGGVIVLVFMLLPVFLPWRGLCTENTATDETVTHRQGKDDVSVSAKPGSARKKGKKPNISDPRMLTEIVEKAIQTGGGANGAETDNLDLPVRGRISSIVGLRQDPINGRMRIHNGIDIAIPEGTPVAPVASGTVIYSGAQPGYGNMVIVRHRDGMVTIYAHHSRNIVKTGDPVDKKTMLAYSGSTGHSTGPHLHFEAWQGKVNVTEAFLPNFVGNHIVASSDASLDKTNLRKAILSDGTILFVEVARRKN
jgi:murein DD-endopeptidase MepM/ murein hydrolase activator NlpD